MKRPKLPTFRVPEKYRDGKVLTAALVTLEEKFTQAEAIEDPQTRFVALGRVEKKAGKLAAHATRIIHNTAQKKTYAGVYVTSGTGIGLMMTSIIVAPPVAPFLLAGGFVLGLGGQIGFLTARERYLNGKGAEKPESPLACIARLESLSAAAHNARTTTALAQPMALMETPGFEALCLYNSQVQGALTTALKKAFADAQQEKPAPVTDLTAALSKPRLPQAGR